MCFAKGLFTTDRQLAESTYMRWIEEFGDVVEMVHTKNGYSVTVLPYLIESVN